MGVDGRQLRPGTVPEAQLDAATQSKLNSPATPALPTTITGNRTIVAADGGKVFYVPATAGTVIFTLDTGLANGFTFTIVALNADTTLAPASGEKLTTASVVGAADQTVSFDPGNHGQWILDRSSNTWLPMAVASGVVLVPTVLPVTAAWQDFDVGGLFPSPGGDYEANLSFGGTLRAQAWDDANSEALNLSPGSIHQISGSSGPIDLTPLTLGSPVEFPTGGGLLSIRPEIDGDTNLAIGLLGIQDQGGGGTETMTLTADFAGATPSTANLLITVS